MSRSSLGAARRRRRSWRTWALAAGLTAAVAVITVASAAQLTVLSRGIGTATAAPCTTLTLPTTATGTLTGGYYSAVQIVNIPPECENLPVSLVVYDASGTKLVTDAGSGNTGAMGTATIATGSYSAASVVGVALLINTWGVHTSWVSPSSIFTCVALSEAYKDQSPKVCSLTNYTITGPTGPPGGQRMDITFTVVSNSKHSRVTIDFTAGVFPWTPTWVAQATPVLLQTPSGYTCPPLTKITVEDPPSGNGDFTATVTITQNGAPVPLGALSQLCP